MRLMPVAIAAAAAVLAGAAADACTRVLWNTNKLGVFTSRTMDWPESTESRLVVFPRGMARDGGILGGETIVKENPAHWTSRYGSIITSVYHVGSVDGFNEKGLGGHLLYLTATDFGPRDAARPAVHAGLWLQYVLDNAASVSEALELLQKVQIRPAEARGRPATVHLAIEDASGDSAIIEHVNGKEVVHHGREYRVMTNDPPYDEQLALLAKLDFSKPSSELPLPGNVNPRDRFARATYYLGMLPEPASDREAVASVLAIARNVSVPFGAPYKSFGIYNTEYRTVVDLTNRRYFFELTTIPNVIWVELAKFNLAAGAPVMLLNPDNIALSGDVSGRFKKVTAPF
ncbi:MAG: linear amide C-N hydrolase [Proteobacteria bacterium]|nr:linear amide C-N hydrolase [Pseudomonadota bacterium]